MQLFRSIYGQNAKEVKPTTARKYNQQPVKTDSIAEKVIRQEVLDETNALIEANNILHSKQMELKRRQGKGG